MEDLYRPYRPKRRTRATIAKEKGLEPLANTILLQMTKKTLEEEASAYIDPEKEVNTWQEALQEQVIFWLRRFQMMQITVSASVA